MDELIANDPECLGALMQAVHAGAALVTFVFKCN